MMMMMTSLENRASWEKDEKSFFVFEIFFFDDTSSV